MTKGVLPTKRQVISELGLLIQVERASHTRRDGKIHDERVLHTIRCLELALLMVKEWKEKK